MASAGSGKTMSLLAKIEYIHRELDIPAEQILAISFTKKTVLELIERCVVKNVNICTFHGLGNSIVKMSASPELGARELIDDAVIADFIRRKIAEFCQDEKFWRMLNDYILFYYSAPASPGEFVDFAARISFNRLYLRRALKGVEPKEFIRSKEEQLIANWLRIHQLEYRHQIQYPFTEARYRPSFTVGDVYIDLLQINRDGSSPQGKEYLRELKWRRKIHQKYQTKYVELYSYQ
ncbi:MAG: AAA family ATPase [Candidatus Saccharibacteria bacterium]|nr:AAA family ATPase [Candidatus Saccharibacteria bacterium]